MLYLAENGEVLWFSDYIVSESILPKKTEYGTDYTNKEWRTLQNLRFIFTIINKRCYVVIVGHMNQIAFAPYVKEDIPSLEDLAAIKTDEELLELFPFDRRSTHDSLRVFNKVFYVVVEAIRDFKLDVIRFDAADPKLKHLYERMIENKYLMEHLRGLGFEYDPKETKTFTFRK
jgi:hypothetical protein